MASHTLQDAVLRNLQTMSESTQRLSDALRAAHRKWSGGVLSPSATCSCTITWALTWNESGRLFSVTCPRSSAPLRLCWGKSHNPSRSSLPNHPLQRTRHTAAAPLNWVRSPGRCASGRTRQLSRELLPAATRRENQELKTDAPSGHGLAAALGFSQCKTLLKYWVGKVRFRYTFVSWQSSMIFAQRL